MYVVKSSLTIFSVSALLRWETCTQIYCTGQKLVRDLRFSNIWNTIISQTKLCVWNIDIVIVAIDKCFASLNLSNAFLEFFDRNFSLVLNVQCIESSSQSVISKYLNIWNIWKAKKTNDLINRYLILKCYQILNIDIDQVVAAHMGICLIASQSSFTRILCDDDDDDDGDDNDYDEDKFKIKPLLFSGFAQFFAHMWQEFLMADHPITIPVRDLN